MFARTITVVFQHAADKAAEEARFRTLDILHVSALGVQALRVAIPALIVSLFVSADMVSNMLSAIPEFVTRGLQIAGGFIVVVGYAMVLRMMGVKYLMPFFPRFPRRWLPRSQSAGVRWRRRDHGPALHPVKSTVA